MTENQTGAGFDRRAMLHFGMRIAATLSAGGAIGLLGGCSTQVPDPQQHAPLVRVIADALLPATDIPGAGQPDNVAFVLRAIDGELMKVPRDLIDQLLSDLRERGFPDLVTVIPDEVARWIAALDRAVMLLDEPRAHPWFALKALIAVSYFTSEAGMTQLLRYELSPGRYDSNVVIGADWKPLSNDWSAVSVRRQIRP